MKRYSINAFLWDVEDDGSIYVSADFDFNPKRTFELTEEGDLYFIDEPPWEADYFYFDEGKWIYYSGEDQTNV